MRQYDGQLSLQIQDLNYSRADHPLFSDFNLRLNNHQAGQLIGSNGSGKSSLLALVAGLIPHDEACIRWCGQPINELGTEYKQQLLYLGHKLGLKSWLTAEETIQWIMSLRDINRPINPHEILSTLGLKHKAHCLVSQLSAGQQQRLALARLLLYDAPLWLLDEPLTSLDESGITLLTQFIHQHLEAGGLLLLSTHHSLVNTSDNWQIIQLDAAYA